jgi:lipopolysaccharide biosynthesis protein
MARLIAFYLPQYHPIPENDAWWGKGFTEWTNVARAKPLFKDHHQPQIPADLGFYDLRLDEVRNAQAELASQYGISGFCYYYYWFNGRRLLERPLDALLQTKELDFPFCICWANESWSRRWDGSEQELLMEQVHTPDSDKRFIEDVIPILKDSRYIRVGGAPLLLVYRISLLPDPVSTTECWRKACADAGLNKIHIAAVRSFGIEDPRIFGCDSAVEFPPHGVSAAEISKSVEDLDPSFEGKIYDYRDLIAGDQMRPRPEYPVFPCVMPAWDNTARRGLRGHIFHHATPEAYEIWLRSALGRAAKDPVCDEEIVFINAWNEWAEGTHLEPDKKWGHANLEATRRALEAASNWVTATDNLKARCLEKGVDASQYLETIKSKIQALETANSYLKRQVDLTKFRNSLDTLTLEAVSAGSAIQQDAVIPGYMYLEQVNNSAPGTMVRVREGGHFYAKGWNFTEGLAPLPQGKLRHLALIEIDRSLVFWCPLTEWDVREDVARAFPHIPPQITKDSGFSCMVDVSGVPKGAYYLALIERGVSADGVAFANCTLHIS